MFLLISALAVIYIWIISRYIHHWSALAQDQKESRLFPEVTVIIPYRNESKRLTDLIESLNAQSYPEDKFTIILIDDHSQDDGPGILEKMVDQRYLLLANDDNEVGKKSALEKGLAHAIGEWVLFTDADTIRGSEWLKNMIAFTHEDVDMVAGPVLASYSESPYYRYFDQELIALSVITGGALKGRLHALANGANMLIRRSALPEKDPFKKKASSSGDDLFISEHFFEKNAITFASVEQAAVYTFAPSDLSALLDQKVRWAGKFRSITDWRSRFILIIIGMIPLTILVCLLMAFFAGGHYLVYALLLFTVKWLADYRLILYGTGWLNRRVTPVQVIRHELLNLLVFGLTSIRVILGLKSTWKGRDMKSA